MNTHKKLSIFRTTPVRHSYRELHLTSTSVQVLHIIEARDKILLVQRKDTNKVWVLQDLKVTSVDC